MRTGPRLLFAAALLLGSCGSDARGLPDALAAGWTPRFDEAAPASEPGRFLVHPDGMEVKPGANANLWHRDLTANGNFRLSVEVTHLDSGLHPHGAGVAFGGSDVHGANQRYTYFLVRSDRNFLIKTRSGEESPVVVPWTEHAAISPEDEHGVTRNRLTVEVTADDVRFLVNGREVHRGSRKDLPVDGSYGYRLVHDLHVKFGTPVVERLD